MFQTKKEIPSRRLLSLKNASLYLGMSLPTIRGLIWAGKLPCVRVSKKICLDIYDLEKVIEEHKMTYTF